MRWIGRETKKNKIERLCRWHYWYAWHPVKAGVENGHKVVVWLSFVERRGEYHDWADSFTWFYKEIEKQNVEKDLDM